MPRKKSASKRKNEGDQDGEVVRRINDWNKMQMFASFVVTDNEGNQHKFMKGDVVAILPHGIDPNVGLSLNEYWIAKIREIREVMHDDNSNEVWAKVQWYYSPVDVASKVKSFNPDACGENEFIFADDYDLVAHDAFNEVIKMAKFDEEKLEQDYIDSDQLYCRYTFEVKRRVVCPKPGLGTCICSQPYSPSDPNSLVHICPRPSCRKSFHQACLLSTKGKEKARYIDNDLTTRDLRMLAALPDEDNPVDLEQLMGERPRKKRRRSSRGTAISSASANKLEGGEEHGEMDLHTALAEIPDLLLKIAQHPIIRGGAFGIAGNIGPVVRARRMVLTALTQVGSIPEGWEEAVLGSWPGVWKVFGEDGDETNREEGGLGATVFVSPAKGAGSSTKARSKTGKLREKKGKEKNGQAKTARFSIPALLCPDCGGAI